MTNRETMPGATGKIPKNADNKNESSRARPPSPVCPALVAGARWRRSSVVGVGVGVGTSVGLRAMCAGSGCRRRRRRRRHCRRVVTAWGCMVVAVAVQRRQAGSSDGGDGRGGETKNRGRRGGGWKKMQKPWRVRRFVGGQYAAMNAYYIYL